jgi:hypothetical protein
MSFSLIGRATVTLSVEQYGCENKLAVYVTANSAYTTPPGNRWASSIFSIMWPVDYGNTVIAGVTGQNGFPYSLSGGVQSYGTTHYFQQFSFIGLSYTYSMTAGSKHLVALIDLNGDIFGDFKIPESSISGNPPLPPKCNFASVLGPQHVTTYDASQVFGVNLFAGVFWEGAGSWCGGTGTSGAPGPGDGTKRCYIEVPGAVIAANAQVKSLNVLTGSDITINSFYDILFDITIDGTGYLTISPTGSVTSGGVTTLSNPQQIKILASSTSVGSFIDGGTINHGTTGSADVQTYLKNSAVPGSYYAHLVGPTVNDPAFQTAFGYPGVYLQSFDLGISTYAYEYSEPTNTWINIFANLDDVRSTKGILMSTVDQTDHTLTMTGQLVTGAISSAPLSYTTNQLELLSNPYASGLDFLLLYNANNTAITNKYQIYDPSFGNYKSYITTGGGDLTKDIQVGQAFFVETLNTSSVLFNNTMRLHSTAPFLKDEYAHQLRLNLAGNGFENSSFIYFKPEGNWGYDQLHDIYKWFSILPEASEIWTVANDQSLLSFNSLPSLGSEMVSVPMGFKCSTEGIHTITAENINSFDGGTEIYLEDLVTSAEWHNLVQNPVYEFTGSPDDEQNRFIVHFFGPTGINDPDGSDLIDIYAWGQDAYIVNRGNETVKEYVVYDLMGRELNRGTLPNNTVNKVTIGDVSAYYIVKVITKEGRIYNDKVYITK